MVIKVGSYGLRKAFEVEIGSEDLVTPSGLEFVGTVLNPTFVEKPQKSPS